MTALHALQTVNAAQPLFWQVLTFVLLGAAGLVILSCAVWLLVTAMNEGRDAFERWRNQRREVRMAAALAQLQAEMQQARRRRHLEMIAKVGTHL